VKTLDGGHRIYGLVDDTIELARHEFQRTFNVFRDLRAADTVMGLPWLDDKHASLQFDTTMFLNLMDGTATETHLEERRPKCLLTSFTKVQNLMRKTRHNKGHKAKFYVTEITHVAD
jgi:hypothetical protein